MFVFILTTYKLYCLERGSGELYGAIRPWSVNNTVPPDNTLALVPTGQLL